MPAVNAPLHVLIVEDSEDDAMLIAEELREGGYALAAERIETREALIEALDRPWDIVIADYRLPHFSGIDALGLVRERDPDIPFIIVSGQIAEDTAVEAMRLGAQDYILKDNLARLAPAVDRELREARIRRERKEAQKALARSEQILQSVMDSSSAIIVLKDLEFRYMLVNAAGARFLGLPKHELIGKTSHDLLPKKAADERVAHDREVIETRQGNEYEETVEIAGDVRTFLTSRFPVYDSTGSIYGVGSVATDITERKQTEAALENERRRLAALESISEAGLSTLDLRRLLDALVEQIALALDAEASCLFVVDEQAKELVAYAAHNVPGLIGQRVKMTEGFIGEVLKSRQPVCLTNAKRHPALIDSFTGSAETLLGAPLIARDRVVGVTRVQSFRPRDFNDDEMRLLAAMADRAALAIDNAELYEDLQRNRAEMEQALEREKHFSLLLQRALLPEAPYIGSGYNVAAEYVPAPFTGEIGGDFYDVFRMGEHTVGVLIGDVSGNGLEAAAMAATTRSTVHAFLHETGSVSEALTKANSVMYSRQLDFLAFATVFLVMIDLPTGDITYSSAGHPPPLICGCDGRLEHLQAGQMPLGIVQTQQFEAHTSHLNDGDSLLLYTDGISEAKRGIELFETEGIENVVRRRCTSDASRLAKDLLRDATEWAEGRLRDDAAVVVVSRESVG